MRHFVFLLGLFMDEKKKRNICCLRNAISIRMFKLHTNKGILKDTHGDR